MGLQSLKLNQDGLELVWITPRSMQSFPRRVNLLLTGTPITFGVCKTTYWRICFALKGSSKTTENGIEWKCLHVVVKLSVDTVMFPTICTNRKVPLL